MKRSTKLKLALLVVILIAADIALAYYYIIGRPKNGEVLPVLAASGGAVAADTSPVVPVPLAAVRAPRYRVPSANPFFGTRFDYSHVVSGNIGSIKETQRVGAGILVDIDTHQVLWEKKGRTPVPVASMTKMMTCLLLFERMERDDNVSFDTWIPVTKAASMVGESSVYLRENETFQVRDYLRAVIIKSANDAAFALGEYLGGGDIEQFVGMMNRRAAELGFKGAEFHTPNGLPDKKRRECMVAPEGMAVLAERLLEYPAYLDFSSDRGGKIRQMNYANTNHALLKLDGVDGMKTGFTNKARSCVTVSCKRSGRRLVLVLTGMPSAADRTACATKLLAWGFKRR
ncbi:MAG: serine hydrolase [Victivallaceae bacterium]|nr:serine hydrolase [Victivallaceae bacterium]